ncbi:MAG TPA: response regulator transcription factor [Actinomycetota bacterium]|nr:response regulator transcription factor [Actinomycetota bacterium]
MRVDREPVTLLICDDHKVLTDALAMVVDRDGTFSLASPPVHDPERAVDLCRRHRPDVVLMDIEFKGRTDGIEATRRIKEVSPATKVIIMTAHDDDRTLAEAVEAGASGFLGKDEAATELLATARSAAEGEALIDPQLLSRLLSRITREREEHREVQARFARLSEREGEILRELAQGGRNDDIAARLFISPQTVQTHIRNLLHKLEVHSKLEAVILAVRHRYLEL